jgi:hypothetical protein
MSAPKPVHQKTEADIRAAQRYLETMSEDDTLTPDEIRAIQQNIDAVGRGEMTLAEFERKYDL